ncbi:MAG: polyprenyl synthetase family protein [Planctomycetaceae bacterium]|nr:polyprenyl synthetase family protein [Planctomycetaceae bacterium]
MMASTGNAGLAVPQNLLALYAPVAAELDDVESLLQKELSSDNPFVDQLAQHGFRLGGKRIRPALVLLAGQATGCTSADHVTLAVATELIHTASLVHDDVLDEATIRRHLDTINARWDNETSVLLGDYLFARAMCLTSSLEESFACRVISQSARDMCEGELTQVHSRGNYDLTEAEYEQIVAGKTAALMASCCRLGAHYAGASEATCEMLAQYGHDLGVAFQIADDVLDLVGEESAVGKSLGTDLSKEKATLPLIRLLATVKAAEKGELESLLANSDNHRREALRPWLARYDAIGYARSQARLFTQRASSRLASLPHSPAVESLLGLADFVVERRH